MSITNESVNKCKYYPQEGPCLINTLPSEILPIIISYLDNSDLQQVPVVSRVWRAASIENAKNNTMSLPNFLAKCLPESCANQKGKLLAIRHSKEFSNLETMIQIKQYHPRLKENILNILKYLNETDLNNLEELSKEVITTKSLRNLFALAKLYMKFEEASQGPVDEKLEAFISISIELVLQNDIAKAAQIVNALSPDERPYAWRKIFKALKSGGNIDKALKFTNAIPEISPNGQKDHFLAKIAKSLANFGDCDKARQVANTISGNLVKANALSSISITLACENKLDKALQIANTISWGNSRSLTLSRILKIKAYHDRKQPH